MAARIGVRVASALSAALVVAVVLVAAGVVVAQLVGNSVRRDLTGRADVAAVATDTLGYYLMLAAPVLIVVIGLVIYFFNGRVLRPVEVVRARAAAAGGLDTEPTTQDEVARLSETVDALLARLGEARTAQQRFAAAGSDLRAPLATLTTCLDQFQRGTADRSTLTVLRSETERLGHVIESLLAAAGESEPPEDDEPEPVYDQQTTPVAMSGGFAKVRPAPLPPEYDYSDPTTVITPVGRPSRTRHPVRDEDAKEDPITAPRGIPVSRPSIFERH